MFRRSLAALLASVAVAAVSLSASPGTAHAATAVQYFAGAQQTVSDSVVSANFGVGKPIVAEGDGHSAAMMVARDGSGNGVGIGWMVDAGLYGDDEPHLTVAWWKDGAGQCYNTECSGYTPYSGATLAAGRTLTSGVTQRFGLYYFDGAWWLWAGTTAGAGSYIGYYADTNWTAPWPTFSKVQVFGEVTTTALDPVTEMGNGVCGDSPSALAIGSVAYSTTATVNLTTFATYPGAYSAQRLSARTIRYGGAGRC
jgi:hypothetical protein